MTRELTTKSPSGRVKRTPIGASDRLSVKDKDPNYVYRIVNTLDHKGGDRISVFQAAGYEVDPVNNGKVDTNRVDSSTGLGSIPEFSVGQGKKALVMRIPKEFYREDQEAKLADIKAQEQTMYDDARKAADYGSFKPE